MDSRLCFVTAQTKPWVPVRAIGNCISFVWRSEHFLPDYQSHICVCQPSLRSKTWPTSIVLAPCQSSWEQASTVPSLFVFILTRCYSGKTVHLNYNRLHSCKNYVGFLLFFFRRTIFPHHIRVALCRAISGRSSMNALHTITWNLSSVRLLFLHPWGWYIIVSGRVEISC